MVVLPLFTFCSCRPEFNIVMSASLAASSTSWFKSAASSESSTCTSPIEDKMFKSLLSSSESLAALSKESIASDPLLLSAATFSLLAGTVFVLQQLIVYANASVFQALPCLLSLPAFIFLMEWTHLHAPKFNRRAMVFDEASLLAAPGGLEFESANMIGCTTPFDGPGSEKPPAPKTFWEALFFDDRAFRMNQFYREMYGDEFTRAQRALNSAEAVDAAVKTARSIGGGASEKDKAK